MSTFPASMTFAQELNCDDPFSQAEMNHCSYKEYLAADKILNEIWPVVRNKMRSVDDSQPKHLKGAAKSLLKAQKAWITYKEAHCSVEGFAARGGTLEPLIVSICLTKLTVQRTKEFKELLLEY